MYYINEIYICILLISLYDLRIYTSCISRQLRIVVIGASPLRRCSTVRFFTLVLLLLFTYVFSVAFMQFSRGTALEQKFFSSMGSAIWTLTLDGKDVTRSLSKSFIDPLCLGGSSARSVGNDVDYGWGSCFCD